MRDPPPEVIATWPEPDYVDPEYIGNQLIVIGIVFGFLSIVTICLRLWVRLWMKRNAGWDDLLIVIGQENWLAEVLFVGGWGYDTWLWVIIEINLSVICASIPTLRPLYHHIVVEGLRSMTSGRARAKYEMSTADEFVLSSRKDFQSSQIRQMTTIEVEEFGHDRHPVTSRLEAGTLDNHHALRQPVS
ncbi:hypothetical protein KEM54_001303 [Ascosphaera aggregata]|nr:hypothetical protein KEM54_001303 [Ascosphaera aggregata]